MEENDLPTGLMSNALDLKEIFFSNLLLLGFDAEAEEANHRIPFDKDMFVFPNKKAMEIVCHFLFCQLDPKLAFQEFRDCWPIQNKKMEQQFRKSCHSWVTKLHKEEPHSNLPRTGPSLFLSPGGDRFYELMLYFSIFVLRTVMARDHGKYGHDMPEICTKSTKNPKMTRIACKALKTKVLTEKNRFFPEVQYGLEVQEHWKLYATKSTKQHRKLTKENRELERKKAAKEINSFDEEAAALWRTRKLQEVRELWKKILHFYNATKEKRDILDTIIEGNEECFRIDGSEIQLQIPESLVTEYRHHIQVKNIGNTYQAGKLNLLSFIQLCGLSLHKLKEQIRQDGVQNFEQCAPFVKNELHGHLAHLANAQKLRSILIDVIPEIKESIEKLKEEYYGNLEKRSHSPVALESFDFGLGLLPATPSPAFSPTYQPLRERLPPEDALRKTPQFKETPDAVKNLTSSIREMVIKNKKGEKHISERSVEGSEVPEPFSKIPRPVNRNRHNDTPKISKKKKTVSINSKKKNKNVEKNTNLCVDDKRDGDSVDHSTKSVMKKSPVSAQNALAEKIAKAVFADEPVSCTGNSSSQSSSGENTPKDIGLADPLENINEEAFKSKNLIPRTPFKEDPGSCSDDGDEKTDNVVKHTDNRSFSSEISRDFSSPFLDNPSPSQHYPVPHQALTTPTSTPTSSPNISRNKNIGNRGLSSVYQTSSKKTKPFSITFKTPVSLAGTSGKASYTPIENKLTVVNMDTPYSDLTPKMLPTSLDQRNTNQVNILDNIRRSLYNFNVTDVDNPDLGPADNLDFLKPDTVLQSPRGGSDNAPILTPTVSTIVHQSPPGESDNVPILTPTVSPTIHQSPRGGSDDAPILTPTVSPTIYQSPRSGSYDSPTWTSTVSTAIHQSPRDGNDGGPTWTPKVSKTVHQSPHYQDDDALSWAPKVSTSSIRSTLEPRASSTKSMNDLLLRYQRLKEQQELSKTTSSENVFESEQFLTPSLHSSLTGEKGRTTPYITSTTTPLAITNWDDELVLNKQQSISQVDVNRNSFPEKENENIELSKIESPKLLQIRYSSSENGSEKREEDLFSVDNLLNQDFNLTPVDVGDLFTHDLINEQPDFLGGEDLEDILCLNDK